MIATGILTALTALLAWIVLFYAIPWMAQRATVYGLHGLRDRLARLGEEQPWLRDTHVYRDADFALATLVRVAREYNYFEFVHTVRHQLKRPRPTSGTSFYTDEVARHFGTPERVRVLAEVVRVVDGRRHWLMLRAVLGHAVMIPFSVVLLSLAFAFQAYLSLMPGPDASETLSAALVPPRGSRVPT